MTDDPARARVILRFSKDINGEILSVMTILTYRFLEDADPNVVKLHIEAVVEDLKEAEEKKLYGITLKEWNPSRRRPKNV